jgi:Delta7-sterol 5-desaturase
MNSNYLTGGTDFWVLTLVIFLRYFIIASIAYTIYYVIKREAWRFKRIQQKFPVSKDYLREVIYSIATTLIFAAVGYLIFGTSFVKLTRVYYNFSEHSTLYFLFSIAAMLVIHDTYFYWTHWLMHRKLIYRFVHKVHHLSTNPSPWAAMAFHPLEAVIEAGVIVVIALLIPFHPLAIGIFLLLMMIYNVYGHLGYELYPKGFSRTTIGKWINTSVNHNLHHQFFTGNYGLYFLFWDRLMGTLQESYDQKFDEVTSRNESTTEVRSMLNQNLQS